MSGGMSKKDTFHYVPPSVLWLDSNKYLLLPPLEGLSDTSLSLFNSSSLNITPRVEITPLSKEISSSSLANTW